MNIHEYQAKKILNSFGVDVLNGFPIFSFSISLNCIISSMMFKVPSN